MKTETAEVFKENLSKLNYVPYSKNGNQMQALERACFEAVNSEGGVLLYYSLVPSLSRVIGQLYLDEKILTHDSWGRKKVSPKDKLQELINNQGRDLTYIREGKEFRIEEYKDWEGNELVLKKRLVSQSRYGGTISLDLPTPEEIKDRFLRMQFDKVARRQLETLQGVPPKSFSVRSIDEFVREKYKIEPEGQVKTDDKSLEGRFGSTALAYTDAPKAYSLIRSFLKEDPRIVKRAILKVDPNALKQTLE